MTKFNVKVQHLQLDPAAASVASAPLSAEPLRPSAGNDGDL